VNWLRRQVLAHFPQLRRFVAAPELDATERKHNRVVRKGDRVLEEYRKLDGALQLYVARRK